MVSGQIEAGFGIPRRVDDRVYLVVVLNEFPPQWWMQNFLSEITRARPRWCDDPVVTMSQSPVIELPLNLEDVSKDLQESRYGEMLQLVRDCLAKANKQERNRGDDELMKRLIRKFHSGH